MFAYKKHYKYCFIVIIIIVMLIKLFVYKTKLDREKKAQKIDRLN